MNVISYPKNKHIKLNSYQYNQLKHRVFMRDNWECQICGRKSMLTLMHKIHKGMGGGHGPGDTEENTYCGCMVCHDEEERNLNGRKKR